LAAKSSAHARFPHQWIHNDFNSRNIVMRSTPDARLCAFDWELATIGLPQRDVVELLAFVLTPTTSPNEIIHWVERSRRLLARQTGRRIDARDWVLGVRAALAELLVDRLATYAMVDRIRAQRFLPRVVRTWLALYRVFNQPI